MFERFEKLVDVTAPPPREQPPASLRALYQYFLAEHKRLFLALMVIGSGVAMADAMVPVFIGKIVTLVAAPDRQAAFTQAIPMLWAMAGFILLLRPLLLLLDLVLRNNLLVPRVTSRIRWVSHWHLIRKPWSFFQNDQAGRIASRVMHMPGALRESVEAAIRAVWYIAIYGGTSLALLCQADWRLALPVLAWFLGYGLLLRHFVPRLRQRARGNAEAYSTLMGRIVDSYSNILMVKLFGRQENEDAYAREALEAHDLAQRRHMRLITAFVFGLALLNTALLAATAGIGVNLWLQGLVGAGALAMALPLCWQMASTAGWVAWEISGIFENVASVQDGMESICAPNQLLDAPQAQPLAVTRGEIRFEAVRFSYEGRAEVFNGFDLTIRPGEQVGIVGRSGAGKSTLVYLLLRLFDVNGGRILIDGQDTRAVTQESLRAAIGVVTQDVTLMHRSILDNIRYGQPEAALADVACAARQAQADEFIRQLRDEQGREGYAAIVGERGVKLSGGQRQRLAMARAILKDAPIMIMDEPTAALDSEAEQAIQRELQALGRGRTMITIAHRLSTLMRMDRILVMDAGRLVEQGTHAELLARGGLYASLWRHQADALEPEAHSLFRNPEPEQAAA